MTVNEALDAMREELPGCSLVAFTDLSSQLVLCTSSAGRPAQEELDSLSRAAQIALVGAVAEGAGPVWDGDASGEPAETAMLLTGSEARVFLRSSGDAPEALVCVCSADADLGAVVDSGRVALDRIMAQN